MDVWDKSRGDYYELVYLMTCSNCFHRVQDSWYSSHKESLIFQRIYWLQQSGFSISIIFIWSWTILKWTHSSMFCFSFSLLKIRDKTRCHKTLMIPAGTLHSCSGKKKQKNLYHFMLLKIQAQNKNNYFWLLLGKYSYVGCNTQIFFFYYLHCIFFSWTHQEKNCFCLFPGKNPIRKCVPWCHAD